MLLKYIGQLPANKINNLRPIMKLYELGGNNAK